MAGTVIFVEFFNLEDIGAGGAFGLLDLRPVNLDAVTDLEIGSIAFERVGLGVAGPKLETMRAGNNAAALDVMAVADSYNHYKRDDRDDANSDAGNLATARTDMAALLCHE